MLYLNNYVVYCVSKMLHILFPNNCQWVVYPQIVPLLVMNGLIENLGLFMCHSQKKLFINLTWGSQSFLFKIFTFSLTSNSDLCTSVIT